MNVKNGAMKKMLRLTVFAFLLAVILVHHIPPSFAQDVEGSKDHPLFTRLPDYYIDNYKVSEFDQPFGGRSCPEPPRGISRAVATKTDEVILIHRRIR